MHFLSDMGDAVPVGHMLIREGKMTLGAKMFALAILVFSSFDTVIIPVNLMTIFALAEALGALFPMLTQLGTVKTLLTDARNESLGAKLLDVLLHVTDLEFFVIATLCLVRAVELSFLYDFSRDAMADDSGLT